MKKILLVRSGKLFYFMLKVICQLCCGHYSKIHINDLLVGIDLLVYKVSKVAKIRNRYNQVPHLTQDTNGKVTNPQKTP